MIRWATRLLFFSLLLVAAAGVAWAASNRLSLALVPALGYSERAISRSYYGPDGHSRDYLYYWQCGPVMVFQEMDEQTWRARYQPPPNERY